MANQNPDPLPLLLQQQIRERAAQTYYEFRAYGGTGLDGLLEQSVADMAWAYRLALPSSHEEIEKLETSLAEKRGLIQDLTTALGNPDAALARLTHERDKIAENANRLNEEKSAVEANLQQQMERTAACSGEVARLTTALEARKWQPIATAPKDGTRFLAGCCHKVYGWIWDSCRWHNDKALGHGYFVMREGGEPTHWMPLPSPPQEPENAVEPKEK